MKPKTKKIEEEQEQANEFDDETENCEDMYDADAEEYFNNDFLDLDDW